MTNGVLSLPDRLNNRYRREFLPPLLLILLLVGIWQLVADYSALSSFILPSPVG